MRYSPYVLLLIFVIGLAVEGCAPERPDWRSDRGGIGGAVRDPLTHELID
nr:hypothetical protein [uncultured Dongia sp.]